MLRHYNLHFLLGAKSSVFTTNLCSPQFRTISLTLLTWPSTMASCSRATISHVSTVPRASCRGPESSCTPMSGAIMGRRMATSCLWSTPRNTKSSDSVLPRAAIAPPSKRAIPPMTIRRMECKRGRSSGRRQDCCNADPPLWWRSMLRHYKERRRRFLISTRASERIDKSASPRTVIEHLERGVEVEDVARGEAAAGAVDGEHGVAVDFVEVDVLQHGASPVREVEEIHARLVG